MYEFFNSISQLLYQPLVTMSSGTNIPLLSALILGILAATAPCQFTGNIGAITLYGNRSLQKSIPWLEVLFFQVGKVFVFTSLGLIVWLLGNEFQQGLTQYFPWFRKMFGPILVIIGLYLIGFISWKWSIGVKMNGYQEKLKGKWGAFLLGSSFSLGFCPTMFTLFFFLLMPLALTTSYGAVLPAVFSLGTSIPLFIAMYLIWSFGLSGKLLKKGRNIGLLIQRFAGALIIFIGVLDTIMYWGLGSSL